MDDVERIGKKFESVDPGLRRDDRKKKQKGRIANNH
jgi:hypothetical protein